MQSLEIQHHNAPKGIVIFSGAINAGVTLRFDFHSWCKTQRTCTKITVIITQ